MRLQALQTGQLFESFEFFSLILLADQLQCNACRSVLSFEFFIWEFESFDGAFQEGLVCMMTLH